MLVAALPISVMRAHTGGAGGRRAGAGGATGARDLPDRPVVTPTIAVEPSNDAAASAASSKASGGRVGRAGGIAGEATLVWEFCKSRCSLVALNRDRNCS